MSSKHGVVWLAVALGFILMLALTAPTGGSGRNGLQSTVVDSGQKNSFVLSGVPHDPIFIDGDTNFTDTALVEGWDGTGSPEEPFAIENLHIDVSGSQNCIYIANTRSHFTIRNCLLGNTTLQGIRLSNVTNGIISHVTIQDCNHGIVLRDECANNTVTHCVLQNNNGQGFYIRINSHSNNFTSNIISGCGANGIYLYDNAHDNWLFNNTCILNDLNGISFDLNSYNNSIISSNCSSNSGRGIYINDSDDPRLTDNTCVSNGDGGIWILGGSDRPTLIRNNASSNTLFGILLSALSNSSSVNCKAIDNDGCGVILESLTGKNHFINNTCTSNQLDGINIGTCEGLLVQNNLVTDNSQYGIDASVADFGNLTDNTLARNQNGMYLYLSNSVTISNNTFEDNTQWGIYFRYSDNIVVENNSIIGNEYGIYVRQSDIAEIKFNELQGNNEGLYFHGDSTGNIITNNSVVGGSFGVRLEDASLDNTITWNGFVENSLIDCQDNGTGTYIHHNYWSNYEGVDDDLDGIGDTPFFLQGLSMNNDSSPLIYHPWTPFQWIESPTDQSMEFPSVFYYDLNTTPFVHSWWLNDTVHFNIDNKGVIRNSTSLSVGIYGLEVHVNNTKNRVLVSKINVIVQDTTDPVWVITPSYQEIDENEPFSYQLEAFDLSGIHSWQINDTLHFSISGTGLITNATVLIHGEYGLTVQATDPYGNTLSGTFRLTVLYVGPTTITTVTTSTITTTVTTTTTSVTTTTTLPPEEIDLLIIVVIFCVGVVGIVVILVIMKRRGTSLKSPAST
ncbi:MAG: right-handed parallel beta-helix repeat-containing protein [Candidatus Thorarchaeota archaeon]